MIFNKYQVEGLLEVYGAPSETQQPDDYITSALCKTAIELFGKIETIKSSPFRRCAKCESELVMKCPNCNQLQGYRDLWPDPDAEVIE